MIAPIIDASSLAAITDALIVDVRWYLDGRNGYDAFLADRIAGARFMDMEHNLAGEAGPVVGRHPLPMPEQFAAGLGAAGISQSDLIVAYDDVGGRYAGRFVWMLRVLGYDAAVLDGGLAGWNGGRENGEPAPVTPVVVEPRPWPVDEIVDADQVAAIIQAGGRVFDSRAAERYRGETEPIDPRAGHVPGAYNLPFEENFGPDDHFLPVADLRTRFEAASVDGDSVFYCGSGVTACNNILAAEAAGLPRPKLYVGSWSGWSSDPARAEATGPDPL